MMADEDQNVFVQWRHAPPSAWQYCPLCQDSLVNHAWDGKMRRYCPHCGFVYWERPLPAVAAVIRESEASGRILLVRRRYPPQEGLWTLPGGGVEAGESIDEAMIREAEEETGLAIALDYQLGTWSTPSHETIITFFAARVQGGMLVAGTDALEAEWFPLRAMPRLAFDTHAEAIERYERGQKDS